MTVRVKVAEGRVVKDRLGRTCSGVFEVDPREMFWAQLLRCGDLVRVGENVK